MTSTTRHLRTLLSLCLHLLEKQSKCNGCDIDHCDKHADETRKVTAAVRAALEAS